MQSPIQCDDARTLIHAALDGELDLVRNLEVEAHLRACRACRQAFQAEQATANAVRRLATRHAAPAALRLRVRAALPRPAGAARGGPRATGWLALAATAACAALLTIGVERALLPAAPPGDAAALAALAGHLRAAQAGQLVDVASSDRHVVKPWFLGRVPLSPPVADLTAEGFPLLGGRLDIVELKPAATLVYGRRAHRISLTVAAQGEDGSGALVRRQRDGFAIVTWSQGGLAFHATSDLNAGELDDFVRIVRAGQDVAAAR